MGDTLDGMTVEQLDDLIKRAQATKEAVEQRDALKVYGKDGSQRFVNKRTYEITHEYGSLPLSTQILRDIHEKYDANEYTKYLIGAALIALYT